MNVFLDSSALVKRYAEEAGSEELDAFLSAATSVGASVIAPAEVVSALTRRRRDALISTREYNDARDALAADLRDLTLIGITEDVLSSAIDAIERWPLRAVDALHIACATAWSADLFVSADRAQLRAARGKGLRVEALSVS